MFWWIFTGAMLGLSVFMFYLCVNKDIEELLAVGAVFFIVFLMLLCGTVTAQMDNNAFVKTFNENKEIIEQWNYKTDYEGKPVAEEKISLNSKLISEQYKKQHYGFFTTMPKEILDLEPIK